MRFWRKMKTPKEARRKTKLGAFCLLREE